MRRERGSPSGALAGAAVFLAALGVGCGAHSTTSDDDDAADGGTASGGVSAGGSTSGSDTGGRGGAAGTGSGGAPGGTSSGGGSAARGSLEDLATGEGEPYWLAIDERYVFWIAGNELRRALLSGGEVSTLATGRGLRRVVAASGYVYFSDGLGSSVARVHRDGGNVEILGDGIYPEGIAVDGTAVYWANQGMRAGDQADGTLVASSLDGSDRVVLAEGLQHPTGVAVDGASLYFTSTSMSCSGSSGGSVGCVGGGVSRVPLEGGEPELVDSEGLPLDVVSGEAGVYWVVEPGRVKFAPRDNGAARTLATLSSSEVGPLAVDAEAVYVSAGGRVAKVPLDGAEPFPVVVDLGTTGGVAVDADWVYVAATSEGRVLRVKKDGSAAEPGPITGPCPTPLGKAEAIAATPRGERNLEQLAVTLDDGEVTASQETYDRLIADVASIRELEPGLADIDYFPHDDGKTLVLTPTELAGRSMQAGEYTAWKCLNDFYGVASSLIDESFGTVYALIELKGIYALDVVASVYAELPGIEHAQPNNFGGDGPTICARRDGTVYEYVVDRAGGDCPAGCTTHEAYHFQSTSAGAVEALEIWSSLDVATAPAWYTRVCTD